MPGAGAGAAGRAWRAEPHWQPGPGITAAETGWTERSATLSYTDLLAALDMVFSPAATSQQFVVNAVTVSSSQPSSGNPHQYCRLLAAWPSCCSWVPCQPSTVLSSSTKNFYSF